jgi:hypothetical protein
MLWNEKGSARTHPVWQPGMEYGGARAESKVEMAQTGSRRRWGKGGRRPSGPGLCLFEAS